MNICRALHGLLPKVGITSRIATKDPTFFKSQTDCFSETEIVKYVRLAADGDPEKISAAIKSAGGNHYFEPDLN